MVNPHVLAEIGLVRHKELLKKAESYRLARIALAGKPTLRDLAVARFANLLIFLGLKLKGAAVVESSKELCCC